MDNLDTWSPEDLLRFWKMHQRGYRHRAVFPAGGRGTRIAVAGLASYAANKATAMICRARGDIGAAMMYEGICERIYSRLPGFARW